MALPAVILTQRQFVDGDSLGHCGGPFRMVWEVSVNGAIQLFGVGSGAEQSLTIGGVEAEVVEAHDAVTNRDSIAVSIGGATWMLSL